MRFRVGMDQCSTLRIDITASVQQPIAKKSRSLALEQNICMN